MNHATRTVGWLADEVAEAIRWCSRPAAWAEQSRRHWRLLLFINLPLAGILYYAAHHTEHGFSFYVRDVASIAGLWITAGALSQLGIVMWAMSAGIALIAALCARQADGTGRLFLYYLATLALSLAFLFDDLYLLHETLAGEFGFPEPLMLGAFILGTVLYGLCFAAMIAERTFLVWGLGMGCFALSYTADLWLMPGIAPGFAALEEVFKIFGISLWLCHVMQSARHDRTALGASPG